MKKTVALLVLLLTALVLTACGSQSTKTRKMEETLNEYRQAVRWGTLEQVESFLDPELLEKNALTELERERFAQLKCTSYRETGAPRELPDGSIANVVQIEYTNIHSATPRRVVDNQVWAWKEKRWVLTSGLPRLERDPALLD